MTIFVLMCDDLFFHTLHNFEKFPELRQQLIFVLIHILKILWKIFSIILQQGS